MSDLPVGWAIEKLTNIATRITKGSTPTSYGFKYQAGGIAFVKVENLENGRINRSSIKHFISEEANANQQRSILETGDVLFSIAGTIGRTCLVTDNDLPANTNQALAIVRGTASVFDPNFLRYQLESEVAQKQSDSLKRGGGMLNVSLADVGNLYALVAPINEQKRIVDKLEKLLGKVEAAQGRLDKIPGILKRFRQSTLAAACSGKLTADWRKGTDTNEWQTVTLRDVADSRLGKMLDKAKNTGTPTPYLRNINVRWFEFDLGDLELMKITEGDKKEFALRNGDLMICEGGEPGRCAVWNDGKTDIVFQKAIHRVRLNQEVTPYWLALVLKNEANSGSLADYFTGTTIKHLTGQSLKTFKFLHPPLEEQKEIVRRVEELFKFADQIEGRYKKARSYTDKLTQSILAKAFRGELVPQDPNDEPASELLKRLKS